MGRLFRGAVAVAAVFGIVSIASAQDRAILRITVEDETGGVLSGAKLTLTHKASAEAHKASTDNAGRTAFESLVPGEYALKVEAPGFVKYQREVNVGANPQPLKVQLQIEVTEEVSVTAIVRPERRTGANQNADVIDLDNDLLDGLPLPMNSQGLAAFLVDFMSSGAGASDPTVVIDGMEGSRMDVPIAAIRHILVNKNPYSPEYRKPGKARVEVITQDGSRRHFNGNAGLTFTSSGLQAQNAFAPDKPDSHKDLSEIGLSGPLFGKLGQFVVSGQYLNDQQVRVVNAVTPGGPVNTTVPTRDDSAVFFARTDLKLSGADRMGIRYDFDRDDQRNSGVGGLRLPELASDSADTRHQVRISLDSKLSAASANQLRVRVERDRSEQGSAAARPKVVVQGAFESGSNPKFQSDQGTTVEIQNTMDYFRRAHALRFGGQLKRQSLEVTDASNFGGTFQFANLALFSAGQPSVFRINQGAPTIDYSRNDINLFFQDEITLRSNVTLMAGVRYDSQPLFSDRNNVAPRVAVAFAPGSQKTVFRAGAGIFYDRVSERIRQRSLLYDGVRIRETVVSNPSYPNAFAGGVAQTALPSIVRLGPDLVTPYLVQASASVERQLRAKTFLTVEYSQLRGVDMLRGRNANAPQPGTGLRLDPTLLNITQVESTGMLESRAVTFALRSRLGKVVKSSVVYTYSRANDNTPGSDPALTLPADNFNLTAEMGRADFDVRHKLNVALLLTLPHGIQAGPLLALASGAPYDITTGFDNNRDTEVTDRPIGVTRNTGQGPGYARLDLRLMKLFTLPRPKWAGKDDPGEIDINLDALNLLNRTNLGSPIGVISSPLFGLSNSAKEARTIQLSVRFRF